MIFCVFYIAVGSVTSNSLVSADQPEQDARLNNSTSRSSISFSPLDDGVNGIQTTPGDTSLHSHTSRSSPSYSPLDHIEISDNSDDSDEELPSFHVGEL